MIKTMSPTIAKGILETLVAEGKLEEEEVVKAIALSPSYDMKRITDVLHSLLCNWEHGDPKDLGKKFKKKKLCFFPVEENMEGTWSLPFHKKWLGITFGVMKQLEIGEEDTIRKVVKQTKELYKFMTGAIRLFITINPLDPIELAPPDDPDA